MRNFVLVLLAGLAYYVHAQEVLLREINFDKWEWKQISAAVAKQIKAARENEYPPFTEIKGPAHRVIVPSHGITGIMVPEEQAFKGKAAYFEAGKNSYAVGEHAPFGGFVKPDKEYRYEVYLRGGGSFNFRIWLVGVNAEGKKKFLTLAEAITIKVNSSEWNKYEGTFKVPKNTDNEFSTYDDRMLGGIVINPNTKLYIDEFKIFER